MIFHPKQQRLSPKMLNQIADDLIEIGNVASDKEKFRNRIIYDRLMEINDANLVTSNELNNAIKVIKSPNTSESQLSKILQQTLKSLSAHYRELIRIIKQV